MYILGDRPFEIPKAKMKMNHGYSYGAYFPSFPLETLPFWLSLLSLSGTPPLDTLRPIYRRYVVSFAFGSGDLELPFPLRHTCLNLVYSWHTTGRFGLQITIGQDQKT